MPYYPPAGGGTNYQPYLGKTILSGFAGEPTFFDPAQTTWSDGAFSSTGFSASQVTRHEGIGWNNVLGVGQAQTDSTQNGSVPQNDIIYGIYNADGSKFLESLIRAQAADGSLTTYSAYVGADCDGARYSFLRLTEALAWVEVHAEIGQTAPVAIFRDGGGTARFQITPTGGIISSPIVSGALPTVSPVSGTALQISTAREVNLIVPVTFNPTGAATATCKVELSPDNVTFSTAVTKTFPISVALAGSIDEVTVRVPAAWYVKLTVTNATLGTGTYW